MSEHLSEKAKYDYHYKNPNYKLGPHRYKTTTGDVNDIIKEYGPFKNHIDVSCGRGEIIDCVKAHGITSKGTEIVDDLVASREDIVFSWCDDLPFEDNEFDFLTNCDAMEHYPPEITIPTLDEFFRVCSRVAYFTISNKRATKNDQELHINIKPYDEWFKILLEYGEVKQRPYGRTNSVSEAYLVIKK